jgi:hypothetical protein
MNEGRGPSLRSLTLGDQHILKPKALLSFDRAMSNNLEVPNNFASFINVSETFTSPIQMTRSLSLLGYLT